MGDDRSGMKMNSLMTGEEDLPRVATVMNVGLRPQRIWNVLVVAVVMNSSDRGNDGPCMVGFAGRLMDGSSVMVVSCWWLWAERPASGTSPAVAATAMAAALHGFVRMVEHRRCSTMGRCCRIFSRNLVDHMWSWRGRCVPCPRSSTIDSPTARGAGLVLF
ncbi:hypothetical protein ACLOJK_027581 [Asimina triloba]